VSLFYAKATTLAKPVFPLSLIKEHDGGRYGSFARTGPFLSPPNGEKVRLPNRNVLMGMDDFLLAGSRLMLIEKKRKFQDEKFEILSRYQVTTIAEFEEKIKSGEIIEHPAWEDLIELKNIEVEIKEINDDIQSLQAA